MIILLHLLYCSQKIEISQLFTVKLKLQATGKFYPLDLQCRIASFSFLKFCDKGLSQSVECY